MRRNLLISESSNGGIEKTAQTKNLSIVMIEIWVSFNYFKGEPQLFQQPKILVSFNYFQSLESFSWRLKKKKKNTAVDFQKKMHHHQETFLLSFFFCFFNFFFRHIQAF